MYGFVFMCSMVYTEVTLFSFSHLTIYIYFHATLDARYVIYVLTIKLGHIVIST